MIMPALNIEALEELQYPLWLDPGSQKYTLFRTDISLERLGLLDSWICPSSSVLNSTEGSALFWQQMYIPECCVP
jgi:hypothetical protein